MYKTVTLWILGKEEKLKFQADCEGREPWIRIDDGNLRGDVSIHFDADGLRQFIFALEGLERKMKEAEAPPRMTALKAQRKARVEQGGGEA